MGFNSIERVLKTFGVTKTESEVYVFLAKHGVLNNREVARQMKKDRGLALRILKSLQTKGLVEATLESPTRYVAVPFEQIIDLSIKARRDEAAIIEDARNQLLDYWRQIGKTPIEPSLEKFAVIEDDRKIYLKIAEMIRATKNQLLSVSTVSELMYFNQFGTFKEISGKFPKSNSKFRFITEASYQNVDTLKSMLRIMPKKEVSLKVRNSDLGLRPFPRIVTRDHEESMIFIEPRTEKRDKRPELCLWTNSHSIVNTFEALFEDLWQNSSYIEKAISEIQTGRPASTTSLISDPKIAKKKLEDTIRSAREEIILLAPSAGVVKALNTIAPFREVAEKGVRIQVMEPITKSNLKSALKFSKCCQVRHVPPGYLGTTIVDSNHLFQFKNLPSDNEIGQESSHFKGIFYTSDRGYIEKAGKMLGNIWEHAIRPSIITVEKLTKPRTAIIPPVSDNEYSVSRKDSAHQKTVFNVKETPGVITEQYVLDQIINAKRVLVKNPRIDVARLYGNSASAVIHTPSSFNLPDMFLNFFHLNKQSTSGGEDWFIVSLWLETPKGKAFVPVATVGDNPKGVDARKPFFAGTPAGQNSRLFKKDELHVQLHGNMLFAGWSVPIPLHLPDFILPPSSILFEGYGKLKSTVVEMKMPSGAKLITEANGFDAFVTYFHPASKYSGPGTDGVLTREYVMTCYPPPFLPRQNKLCFKSRRLKKKSAS